jgi:peptide/nickel transport system permease protein
VSLLTVEDLRIRMPGAYGDVELVAGMDLSVAPGECVGLVGESGCGKTLTGLATMGLLPRGAEVEGEVRWRGVELLGAPDRERRALLGRELAMVYQDALLSLNPSMTVRRQLQQVLGRQRRGEVEPLLEQVSLPDPARIARAYPFQLSGGQRQRVLIALALARGADLLIADEPTTALDETVQAQVVELIDELRETRDFAMLLISHDLALVAHIASRVLVMYAGQLVEEGPVERLIDDPRHPYTEGLLACITSLEERRRPAASVPGSVPSPDAFNGGCRFAPRCSRATAECTASPPPLEPVAGGGRVACYHPVRGGEADG